MASRGQLATVVTASSVGLLLEWYGFYIYGILAATVLNKLFSPRGTPWLACYWPLRAGPWTSL